jgi:hypothetical protein
MNENDAVCVSSRDTNAQLGKGYTGLNDARVVRFTVGVIPTLGENLM